MNTAIQYDMGALLGQVGAQPPRYGRWKWSCPECSHAALSVNLDRQVFHCFYPGCRFEGGIAALRLRLGLAREWLPRDEYIRLRRERERARHGEEEKERVRARMARERAVQKWASLRPAPSNHPYLKRKAIPPLGARLDHDGKLVIPIYGIDCGREVLRSLERIAPDGEKFFNAGCHVRGGYCFLPVGPIPKHPPERVWIAEGFATGASVALATGEAVCCVFTCGNLTPALEALTQRMPGTTFALAADNDSGKPGNPGLTAAKATARRFGLRAAWPTFPQGKAGSDFNDLALEIGINAVREELRFIGTDPQLPDSMAKLAEAGLVLEIDEPGSTDKRDIK